MTRIFVFLAALCALALPTMASAERVRDIGQFQSVRSNQLTGYGIVVGLDSFLDIGIRLPAFADAASIDEGGVPGQVARATGA